jgi:methyl-accepting chemotaxis protein
MVEQSTAAGHSLSQESSKLSQLVSQFQVGRPASEETLRRELKEAAPHAFKARETAPRAAAPSTSARPAPAARPAPPRARAASGALPGDWTEF